MGKVRLFVYGSLRPSESPPKTMSHPEPDAIAGDEIQHEHSTKAAEAVDLGDRAAGKVKGWSMIIDAAELSELDKREAPDYKRVLVNTHRGYRAFAYEYRPTSRG